MAKPTLEKRVAKAVRHFWQTRLKQGQRQGRDTGHRDTGNRTASTGGKQLDEFAALVEALLVDSGVPSECVYRTGRADVTLPGFFRPTKQWDVVVAANGCLLAAIEFKALCGPSFGNNYNNRIEEAVGSSTDIWTAYREGMFDPSLQPFLGYVLLLEEAAGSTAGVSVCERHFSVAPAFVDTSYIDPRFPRGETG